MTISVQEDAAIKIKDNEPGKNVDDENNIISNPAEICKQITKGVVRAKLNKRRHLVIPRAISPTYLDHLMPSIVTDLFQPQTVVYNGGVANIKKWRISCYMEVMESGIPCTCLLYTSPSPRDLSTSRMPSSA